MKNFSIYSAVIMIASAILTWNALAVPVTKLHVLDNLTPQEARLAEKIIEKKGYKLSHQPLFNESKQAVVITKAIGNETEPPSVQVEVVHQEDAKALPKRIYNLKLETKNIVEVLEKLPSPEKLKHTIHHPEEESIPVAFQN